MEELRNSLIMTDPKKYIDSIECVVFDEVHYINNKERGKVGGNHCYASLQN